MNLLIYLKTFKTWKLVIFMTLLNFSNQLLAQQVNGVVMDEVTKIPVADARIITSSHTIFTTAAGNFILNNVHPGDTIQVSQFGYKPYCFKYNPGSKSDTLIILLAGNAIPLQEVTIKAMRNYRLDSLKMRREYAAAFAYKAPGFKDIFNPKSSNAHAQYTPFQSSTSSLVSINLGSIIGLLNRNKTSAVKLQKMLLKEEENNYVDHLFSKERVSSLTSLKGDSLQNFIDEYRPSVAAIKQMTGYELILYIKRSHTAFVRTYRSESFLPSLK